MKELYLEPFRISTKIFNDDRGDFSPLIIKQQLPDFNIVQVNTVATKSPYVFRGLHWQEPPYAQAKLLRCTFGKIIDFAVDIRQGSPNYGKSYAFTLDNKNDWVYIPEGFAHGYLTLPHNLGSTYPTLVEYLINNDYNHESERGMFMTDKIHTWIAAEMPMGNTKDIIMNNRDFLWPTIDEIKTEFKYEPDDQ